MVHSRRKKTLRPSIRNTTVPERVNERFQRRSMSPDAYERAPHSDLSIVDCSTEHNYERNRQLPPSNENAYRKKLYFNPVFFETEHLKVREHIIMLTFINNFASKLYNKTSHMAHNNSIKGQGDRIRAIFHLELLGVLLLHITTLPKHFCKTVIFLH